MSPEQATAEKEITARSDQYSLASVLYEMLTGNPPYTGANAQQIIMKIITVPAEPVTMYRKAVPPNVAAAVARSLEKLPADRFESAKAFSDALGNANYTNTSGAGAVGTQDAPWRQRSMWLAAALVVVAAVGALGWLRRPAVTHLAVSRFLLNASDSGGPLESRAVPNFALSPDGSLLAFAASVDTGGGTVLRAAKDARIHRHPGTETQWSRSSHQAATGRVLDQPHGNKDRIAIGGTPSPCPPSRLWQDSARLGAPHGATTGTSTSLEAVRWSVLLQRARDPAKPSRRGRSMDDR
jgi:hypothetical protein